MRPPTRRAHAPLLGLADNPAYQWWRDATIMQPDSWWGNTTGDEALQAQVALMRELGTQWFRMEAPWRAIAPDRPGGNRTYDAHAAMDPAWPGYRWQSLDRAFAFLSTAEITLLPVVVYAPEWAIYETCDEPSPAGARPLPNARPRPDYWHDFLCALASRYAGRMRAIELWNEPDHSHSWAGSLDEYVRLVLRPGANAVRSLAPQCAMVLGGLASAENLESLCRSARPSDFDIASVHVYPTCPWAGEVRGAVRTAREVLRSQGYRSHQVWVTEWGVATRAPSTHSGFGAWTSEREHARLIAAVNATSGADALFYYQLHDTQIVDAHERVLKEVYWGLVTRDLARRKPAFGAYSASASRS